MKLQDFDFRIWKNDGREYVKNPVFARIGNACKWLGECAFNAEKELEIATYSEFDIENGKYSQAYLNDCEIELYTGFKDKNGVKIYENDIINTKPFKNRPIMCAEGGEWVFMVDDDKKLSLLVFVNNKDVEVIGNIHEDKNLLKENNDENA